LKNITQNFLSQVDLDLVWNEFNENPRWRYTKMAGENMFWEYILFDNIDIHLDSKNGKWDFENKSPIWYDIYKKVIDIESDNFIPRTLLINGQTQTLDSAIHSDYNASYPGEYTTHLIYLNKKWQNEWGGETTFYDREYNLIDTVYPEPGKLLSYDARQKHKGHGPIIPNTLRVTLAIQGTYA